MPSRLQFLDQYSSHNTKLSYRTAIKSFLSAVYKTAIEPDELETYANRYFDEHHNHEKDLGEFLAALQGKP